MDSKWRFYVKGASEVLLRKAGTIVNLESDDKSTFNVIELTKEHRDTIQNIIDYYCSSQYLRTIALAYRDFEQWPPKVNVEGEVSYKDLVDQGIMGIDDPLREKIQMCKIAGVTVRMITCDNIKIAKSIAMQCGIYTGGEVMEGPIF